MRESRVELHLRRVVKTLGGECLKFVSPGRRHVSDRLVFLPGGDLWLVELKAPRKTPRAGQVRFQKRLSALGFRAIVLDTKEKIDAWAKGEEDEAWRKIL